LDNVSTYIAFVVSTLALGICVPNNKNTDSWS